MAISLNQSQRKNKIAWLVAWLIWPLGALIMSLRQQSKPTLFFVLWLFCVFYGWVFIVPADVQGAADAARYARELRIMHEEQYSFKEFYSTLFNADGNTLDIYQPFVTWIIAKFTNDPRWLFTFFALVFGYFYTRNTFIISEKLPGLSSFYGIVFFTGLLLANPIWNINGARMWTAAHVFTYGILLHLVLRRKYAWLWIVGSCLVHFSFILPAIAFFMWKFVPKPTTPLFILFIITAFVQEIDFSYVKETLLLLPEVFHGKVNSYYGEEYLDIFDRSNVKRSIHVVANDFARRIFLYIWILALYIYSSRISPTAKNIFTLALFLGSIANISNMLPSGGRFTLIVEFLLYYPIFEIIINFRKSKWARYALNLTVPLVLYVSAFNFRLGLDFTGIAVFISNPIFGYYFNDQVPVIKTIKDLIS